MSGGKKAKLRWGLRQPHIMARDERLDVRGYVNGVEDPGLRCTACPLHDLVLADEAAR